MSFFKKLFNVKSKAPSSQLDYSDFDPTVIPLKEWTSSMFSSWLKNIGISENTIDILQNEEWDGKTLISFSLNELTELKIPNYEAKEIVKKIDALKHEQQTLLSMSGWKDPTQSSDRSNSLLNSNPLMISEYLSSTSTTTRRDNLDGGNDNNINNNNTTIIDENLLLNENLFIQNHEPQILNQKEKQLIQLFQIAIQRFTNQYSWNITLASKLTPNEILYNQNAITKLKSIQENILSEMEMNLLSQILTLWDFYMFSYFFNYKNIGGNINHSVSPNTNNHVNHSNIRSNSISNNESSNGGSGNNVMTIGSVTPRQQNNPLLNNISSYDVLKQMINDYEEFNGPTTENLPSNQQLRKTSLSTTTATTTNTSNINTTTSSTSSTSSSKSSKPYLLIQLVIFPIESSYFIEISNSHAHRKPNLLFRTGLMIGDWFLEWRETSFVCPTLKYNNYAIHHAYNFVQLTKIEGEKSIFRTLRKISQICSVYNGSKYYDNVKCNHQHFVKDVLSSLAIHSFEHLGAITKIMERIERKGYSEMVLEFSSTVKNLFIKQDNHLFKSHIEIDNFYMKMDNLDPTYFHESAEGRFDQFLLRLFDRCFYLRMERKDLMLDSDVYLSKDGICLCPFNIHGLSLGELESASKDHARANLSSYDVNFPSERFNQQ
ncbi:hypothetical protein ABK040_014091 [Willaertia magna]